MKPFPIQYTRSYMLTNVDDRQVPPLGLVFYKNFTVASSIFVQTYKSWFSVTQYPDGYVASRIQMRIDYHDFTYEKWGIDGR